MSGLQSTVPGSIQAFYNLLVAAGQAQSPPVDVFVGSLQQDEPNIYVMLGDTPDGQHKMVENHSFDIAALGSGALYECFELWGFATCYSGDFKPVDRVLQAWNLYNDVVMDTFINYWGGAGSIGGVGSQVLGPSAPAALESMTPITALDASAPVQGSGFAGNVVFGFELRSRITIT